MGNNDAPSFGIRLVSDLAEAVSKASRQHHKIGLNPCCGDIIGSVTCGESLLAYVWDSHCLEVYLCDIRSLKGSTPVATYVYDAELAESGWVLLSFALTCLDTPPKTESHFELALGWQNRLVTRSKGIT